MILVLCLSSDSVRTIGKCHVFTFLDARERCSEAYSLQVSFVYTLVHL
jgi:hypothetical protein